MADSSEIKGAGAWKWIVTGGAVGLVVVVAVIYGLLALAVSKGKPQIAQALDKVVESQSGKLPSQKLLLLQHLSNLTKQKDASLATIWMISQSVGGAIADGQVSDEETRLLERVAAFVVDASWHVSFKEAGIFMNSDPALKKLIEEEVPPQGTAKKDDAATTGTLR